MLPVPRFTPTVRKFRPQPIDLKEGLKKVKVGTTAKGCQMQGLCAARQAFVHASWTHCPAVFQ